MNLFFLRHAEAEQRDLYPDDRQRPLTDKGRHEQRLVMGALVPLLQPLDHLLSSPLLRARQTADIVAEAVQFAGQVEETSVLAGDCTVGAVLNLLQGYPGAARILCVGHEPDMSRLSAVFLDGQGRSSMAFQAGAVIGLTFAAHPAPGQGSLRFFLRPEDLLPLLSRMQDS
jgi:phosphohistidine phosphatase